MRVSISVATAQDVPALTQVWMAAFENDPLLKAIYTRPTGGWELEEYTKYWESRLEQHLGPSKYLYKAVDGSTGALTGYCGLQEPRAGDPRVESASDPVLPPFANPEKRREVMRQVKEGRDGCLGSIENAWCLSAMAVSPQYQRKGIAKQLLEYSLAEVDKTGRNVYVEASPVATKLYESCGFEKRGRSDFLDGEYYMDILIRDATRQLI